MMENQENVQKLLNNLRVVEDGFLANFTRYQRILAKFMHCKNGLWRISPEQKINKNI